jgi:DNA mismatch endonuclease (patch repair protein)
VTDIVDRPTRSRMMAGIRGKDTKPELLLRKRLFAAGFRYRLHACDVTGRPDLLFPRYRAAVFVHGCFWHRHEGCPYATSPATRPEFWSRKFAANVARDKAVRASLAAGGWRLAVVWECSLRKGGEAEVALVLASWLLNEDLAIEIP